MNRFVDKALFVSAAVFFLITPIDSSAYQYYSDEVNDVGQCAACHGAFRSGTYTSPGEGISWGDNLHNVHLGNTDIETSCDNCHGGSGTTQRQVRLDSSGNAKDGVNAVGCMGCHGRLDDGAANIGAGLRSHHMGADGYLNWPGGIPGFLTCAQCHPADPAPASEDTMPPWYASVTNTSINMTMDPCSADGQEDFSSNGTGLDNDGDQAYDGADSDCVAAVPTPGDINFDGKADILWRNTASGQNWAYLMNAAAIDSSVGINTVSDQAWQIVGNGDYDGDGDADVLWRNSTTGQNWMYLMDGGAIGSSVGVNTVANQDWQVAGNGDYDGDGKADILWRNESNGQNWMYLMNGASISSSVAVNTVSTAWQVAGNGDYNGDGKADILWRHTGTGQVWMYLMNGSAVNSSAAVGSVLTLWQIVGNGDYDGDGKSDILWRRESTGQNWVYLMNGATIASSESVNVVLGTQWQVKGAGDYNGDGKSDILWRNQGTGQNWMYLMNGATIDTSAEINIVGGSLWQIVNVD